MALINIESDGFHEQVKIVGLVTSQIWPAIAARFFACIILEFLHMPVINAEWSAVQCGYIPTGLQAICTVSVFQVEPLHRPNGLEAVSRRPQFCIMFRSRRRSLLVKPLPTMATPVVDDSSGIYASGCVPTGSHAFCPVNPSTTVVDNGQ